MGESSKGKLKRYFFSWMPHTAATLEQRLEVNKLLLNRSPDVGWKLLLDLLPRGFETITNHHTPEWRFWAEGWRRGVTRADLLRTVHALIDLTISTTIETPAKWLDLIPHITEFPRDKLDRVIKTLESVSDNALAGDLRRELWSALREVTEKHRYFADAKWALPADLTTRLEAVRDRLQPRSAVELSLPLFKHGFDRGGDRSLSWEEQERVRRQKRIEAVRSVLSESGFAGVLVLARRAQDVRAVGAATAEATEAEFESQILPSLLCSDDKSIKHFSETYSTCRIHTSGRDWAESLPLANWRVDQAGTFAACMPFDQRTWDFAKLLGESIENEYWRRTGIYNPGLTSAEIEWATRRLIAAGRPSSAIDLLAFTLHQGSAPAPAVLLDLLEVVMISPVNEANRALDPHHIQELLEKLQETPDINETKVAHLEWLLMPMLGSHSLLPTTLHKLLARDPNFFIDLIKLIYVPRSSVDKQREDQDAIKPDESTRQQAHRAWRLLHDWRRIPGTKDDGAIDGEQLRTWVRSAREKAAGADRSEVCDVTIGEMLAHSPGEPDGTWPCISVRDVLEDVECPHIEKGFIVGIFNKRGVYSKDPREGGRQERDLALQYEAYAKACHARWPRTAAALRQVAAGYREESKREDAAAAAEG